MCPVQGEQAMPVQEAPAGLRSLCWLFGSIGKALDPRDCGPPCQLARNKMGSLDKAYRLLGLVISVSSAGAVDVGPLEAGAPCVDRVVG